MVEIKKIVNVLKSCSEYIEFVDNLDINFFNEEEEDVFFDYRSCIDLCVINNIIEKLESGEK